MKPGPFWKVSITTTEAAEEAITEVLSAQLGAPASSYTALKTGKTTVTVYLKMKPVLSRALKEELTALLDEPGFRDRQSRMRLRLSRLKQQNWANSWKHHFKPLEIG